MKWRWEQFVGFGLIGMVVGPLLFQMVWWWLHE